MGVGRITFITFHPPHFPYTPLLSPSMCIELGSAVEGGQEIKLVQQQNHQIVVDFVTVEQVVIVVFCLGNMPSQ